MTNPTPLFLSKTSYSETIVRKALYWLSEYCIWQLEETNEAWKVTLLAEGKELDCYQADYHRLLNDFKLRETLDRNTKHLRSKIIYAALKKIAEPDEPR